MTVDNRFHVVVANESGHDIGFVSYWIFNDFIYIEHLAVEKEYRGKGHGGGLLLHVASLGQPLLLEVEPPNDDISIRRIEFYEHLGLVLRDDVEYEQPPYGPQKPSVPMMLMTSPEMTKDETKQAIETLKAYVYQPVDKRL